jgi:Tfp pilus assembly ATPase PilU
MHGYSLPPHAKHTCHDLRNADSQNDVRLRIRLEGKDANASQLGESMRNVIF